MLDLAIAVREQLATQIHWHFGNPDRLPREVVGQYAAFLLQFAYKLGMHSPGAPRPWDLSDETLIGIWRVSESGTEPVPIAKRETVEIGVDHCSWIVSFWINIEALEVYVSWYCGPLCGHGVKHKVHVHGDAVLLDKGEQCWVS